MAFLKLTNNNFFTCLSHNSVNMTAIRLELYIHIYLHIFMCSILSLICSTWGKIQNKSGVHWHLWSIYKYLIFVFKSVRCPYELLFAIFGNIWAAGFKCSCVCGNKFQVVEGRVVFSPLDKPLPWEVPLVPCVGDTNYYTQHLLAFLMTILIPP